MPGIHGVYLMNNTPKKYKNVSNIFRKSLRSLSHYPSYRNEIICENSKFMLGSSGPAGYPIRVLNSKKLITLCEGEIYSHKMEDLPSIARDMMINNHLSQKLDGDFLLLNYDIEQKVLRIMNDYFGRLPFYYALSNDLFIFSREIKFIMPFLKEVEIDRDAIAEYLLLRYPLGDRTLIKGIQRFKASSSLVVDNKGMDLKTNVHNLDPDNNMKYLSNNYVSSCVNAFIDSTRDRISKYSKSKHIVLLSGGLDSRALLSSLVQAGIKPLTITFLLKSAPVHAMLERITASLLSYLYGLHNITFKVDRSRIIKDHSRIVHLKDGLAPTYRLKNLDEIILHKTNEYGINVVSIGSGGDKTLAPSGYTKEFSNINFTVRQIISQGQIFTEEEIRKLCIDSNNPLPRIQHIVERFPEATLEGKFRHFMLYQRALKKIFEYEDFARFHYPHYTPFYSPRFFSLTMKAPESLKENYYFYKRFFAMLDRKLILVPYANLLMPIGAPTKILKFLMKIRQISLNLISRRKRKEYGLFELKNQLHNSINECHRKYFNIDYMIQLIKNIKNEMRAYTLLAILTYINIIESKKTNFKNK